MNKFLKNPCNVYISLLAFYSMQGAIIPTGGTLFYGSDAGAEMAAVSLSVVSTVKLAGQSVWRFLGDFFEDMVTGGKMHLSLLSLSTT